MVEHIHHPSNLHMWGIPFHYHRCNSFQLDRPPFSCWTWDVGELVSHHAAWEKGWVVVWYFLWLDLKMQPAWSQSFLEVALFFVVRDLDLDLVPCLGFWLI